ncbi:hypothetical protein JHD48_05695 [Sulfurimonas sp. SAG-AH-194-I05]|nr:hypothetical protein [Sulfurimonas sp. SAG-AH-194-I05]MDF1875218.1 hypothetical protein [Sulfurimonas sp. SAG-AH-194-I05]
MKIFLDANICLDLLDTTRPTSSKSVEWYLKHKDNQELDFYFSGDFITTFYYIMTEKRKYSPKDTLKSIDALSGEIVPHYINHSDFIGAKNDFLVDIFSDFEDLLILNSANRLQCAKFITNDKKLLSLKSYSNIEITTP